ncbi:RsmB/NOP family class I SAM-dependent RNA methyltransferase [Novosphingobium sp.]|uniref:RsmB/NOP family class I SAM-dependent RNA methyltransferase n=1 Tax=Novosphingobium sp. TaxID=1874826 RepID=UPI003B51C672
MTPPARAQAAIDLLDAVILAARGQGASADRLAADWFRTRRFVGSKDRRAIRELVWHAIRACGDIPGNGRMAMLRVAADDPAVAVLFDGSHYGPAPIAPDEVPAQAGIAPDWLMTELMHSGHDEAELAALLTRAPLDIRANRLRITCDDLIAQLPVAAEPGPSPDALRLPPGTQAEAWPAFAQGLFEVQDAGSQIACGIIAARAGETVVDLCAGAGGKTLALAAAMNNGGRLIACDIDRTRLSRLPARAARAGATVETRLLDGGREWQALRDVMGQVDAVLVDAPCTGTGTWRRNPEARWRLSPAVIARYVRMQAQVLDLAAGLVRPGGRITFITCSLLDAEGPDAIAAFVARHHGWRAVPIAAPIGRRRGAGWRLTPGHDDTDGFFFANLVAP